MLEMEDQQLKQIRILLADDDEFMQTIIKQVLDNLGFTHITIADDGRQAIKFLNNSHFDLLITDIQMPNVNGLELMKKIRMGETAAFRDLRVITITSLSNTEVLGSAIALDVNAFLVKPVEPATALQKIQQAINEPADLRSGIVYKRVNTQLDILEKAGKPIHSPSPQTPDKSKLNQYAMISINRLKPKMLIARDVRTEDGMLLVPCDQKLSSLTINLLLELKSLIPEQKVWIKRQH